MAGNNSSRVIHDLANRFPGKIGWLQSPSSWKIPLDHIPYALDNDAYSAWSKRISWNADAWRRLMDRASNYVAPLWVLVPDVVANRDATLESWNRYSSEAGVYGWPLAFAVQDGMTPKDVPTGAAVIFVGGTTSFKLRSMPIWTNHFKRVHVGRVNWITRLRQCRRHRVESCDGSGWFRGGMYSEQAKQLEQFLTEDPTEPSDLFRPDPNNWANLGS